MVEDRLQGKILLNFLSGNGVVDDTDKRRKTNGCYIDIFFNATSHGSFQAERMMRAKSYLSGCPVPIAQYLDFIIRK